MARFHLANRIEGKRMMNKKLSVLCLCTVLFLTFTSQISSALAENKPCVVYGPVITGVTKNKAWVAWSTVQDPEGTAKLDLRSKDEATIPNIMPTLSIYHKVHLEGLKEDASQKYDLMIPYKDKNGKSVIASFRTAPSETSNAPFRFIVYGDTRNDVPWKKSTKESHEALIEAIQNEIKTAQDETAIAFLVNTGDLALNLPLYGIDDRGYKEFFEIENSLLIKSPLFTAFGNHESYDRSYFDNLFSGPRLAGEDHPYYFTVDWGNVRIIFIDPFGSPEEIKRTYTDMEGLTIRKMTPFGENQLSWLRDRLSEARKNNKQIFIVSHQGAYSYGNGHGGLQDIRSKVMPLMIEYGVLALFAGHDHYYQRIHHYDLIRKKCTYNLVIGGGGAPMYDPKQNAFECIETKNNISFAKIINAQKALSYLVVTVKGDSVTAEAKKVNVDTNGKVINTEAFDRFDFSPAGCLPTENEEKPCNNQGPSVVSPKKDL